MRKGRLRRARNRSKALGRMTFVLLWLRRYVFLFLRQRREVCLLYIQEECVDLSLTICTQICIPEILLSLFSISKLLLVLKVTVTSM